MTEISTPPRRSNGAVIAVIAIGSVLVVLLVAVLVIWSGVGGAARTEVTADAAGAAASEVVVDIPHAVIRVTTGDGDQVRAEVSGRYLFGEPTIVVATAGGVTRVTGGCPAGPLVICEATVTITLPAESNLEVRGINGGIAIDGVTGTILAVTTNGSIDVDAPSGAVDVRTTNGRVAVTDATSAEIVARTVNGGVVVDCASAPIDVRASSTNGSVRVTVPEGVAFAIDLDTVNGDTEVTLVLNDPSATRSITASTVNGSVEVMAR